MGANSILGAGLLGRKRGIFVLVVDAITTDNSAMNTKAIVPDRASQEITKKRNMKNLQLLAGPNVIPAYSAVRRVGPADLKDALTKGVNDFLPILDFLGKPLFTVLFSMIYAIVCISL